MKKVFEIDDQGKLGKIWIDEHEGLFYLKYEIIDIGSYEEPGGEFNYLHNAILAAIKMVESNLENGNYDL